MSEVHLVVLIQFHWEGSIKKQIAVRYNDMEKVENYSQLTFLLFYYVTQGKDIWFLSLLLRVVVMSAVVIVYYPLGFWVYHTVGCGGGSGQRMTVSAGAKC